MLAALSTKDMPALQQSVRGLPATVAESLVSLGRLSGGVDIIELARRSLPHEPATEAALDELQALAAGCGADAVSIDLADLHGYRYLTGVTFAAHAEQLPSAVLRGGRYDNIGKAFGRARPAVGFSVYLRDLVGLLATDTPHAILAPAGDETSLRSVIRELRALGQIVVQRLPGESGDVDPGDFIFDRELHQRDSKWQVIDREVATNAK